MDRLDDRVKDRLNNFLFWIPATLCALLVVLFMPNSQVGLGEKQFVTVGVTFLGAIALLNTRPKRIVLTILGYKFLILTGFLTALALQ
ncbi:MAG: hypothetical protein UV00_C0032G0015 [candidate division WWE3 bacterium GW2011_GWF1_42_14]|uniref:Uncharacterized protein n=1 Tax=candidate division WWE3 bacterium GW2011_GWF1_42_14 TaxID=1619138 RepID=A0A0G0YGD6_UNCKA|nr:MAG: hypothetical protein UV00_C0032G0015 [candidate division WWE3 bacterium GW2011_GWF1_42_14]